MTGLLLVLALAGSVRATTRDGSTHTGGLTTPHGSVRRGLSSTTVDNIDGLYTCIATSGSVCDVTDNIVLSAPITIDSVSTTIMSSNSAALDGGGSQRLFDITNGAQVTFRGIILKSGSSGEGGCVWIEGSNVTFSHSTLTNCEGTEGGGIYAKDNASVILDSATLSHCSADYGGGLWAERSSTISAKSSNFSACTAGTYGGGIRLDSSGVKFTSINSLFESCSAGSDVGSENLDSDHARIYCTAHRVS